MTVTRGRLNGTSPNVYVVETLPGTPVRLVYDGTGQPSVRAFTVTGLTESQSYAFKVAALSSAHPEGGMGIPSLASTTVIARSGADASQTTAQGSALSVGMTGFVYEVQEVEVSANTGLGGSYVLSVASSGQQSFPIAWNATADSFRLAVEGLAFGNGTQAVGPLYVERFVGVTNPARTGFRYAVTFVSNIGDVPSLVANATNLIGGAASVDIYEFIKVRPRLPVPACAQLCCMFVLYPCCSLFAGQGQHVHY
jgi:hypothetical protein